MNIIKRVIILSAIVLAVSCNKEIETDYRAGGNYITVRTEVATKAGYDNSTLPSSFIMDIIQVDGTSQYNYKNVKMVQVNNSNTYKAQGADGKDLELQWANVDHNAVFVTAVALPSEPETVGDNISISISNNQQFDETNFDILAAKTGNGVVIDGDDIVINFNHLMSKFYVSYEKGTDVSSFKVNSITLKDVCLSGTYDYSDRYDGTDGLTSATNRSDLTLSLDTNSQTAEGIFFPYTPQDAQVSITVNAKIGNKSENNYSATINLKKTSGFASGKRYVVKLKINQNNVTPVDMSSDKEWITNISQEKILWVGTSIPYGDGGTNSYPKMIEKYVSDNGQSLSGYNSDFKVINKAVGSSYVTFDPTIPVVNLYWKSYDDALTYFNLAASLSATREEIASAYEGLVKKLLIDKWGSDSEADSVIDLIYNWYSYSGLILPHIDGTDIDQCSVIVLDYGYNDSPYILQECLLNGPSERPVGMSWMTGLANGAPYYDRFGNGKQSYMYAMSYVIDEINKVAKKNGKNIKIIIGNYFAKEAPFFRDKYSIDDWGGARCCELLLLANQAIATKYNLDIVNVYEYLDLNLETDWGPDEKGNPIPDVFCPDGTHPSAAGSEEIANAYLNEFRRIFDNNPQTKSISSSKDCTWEDVELF